MPPSAKEPSAELEVTFVTVAGVTDVEPEESEESEESEELEVLPTVESIIVTSSPPLNTSS